MLNVNEVKIPGIEKIELPLMTKVQQIIPDDHITDVSIAINNEMNRFLENYSNPFLNKKVAITAGSRGINRIAEVIKSLVAEIKLLGGSPFIVPAMGSHGGGEAEAQKEILANYGITEEKMDAKIVSSLKVEKVGETKDGIPVFVDSESLQADAIVVVNRVKVHTDFAGDVESGLMKMMAIGLGKHVGASTLHYYGFDLFSELIPEVGLKIIEKTPIAMGVSLVENAYDKLCLIKISKPVDFYQDEKELLKMQKKLMPEIPFEEIDILIVDEIGKEISGSGMDTNVVGRSKNIEKNIKIILPLDLTDSSHGNAAGIGLSDITTKKLFDKIDFNITYTNILTSGKHQGGRLPIVLKDDEFAIKTAMRLLKKNKKDIKIVRIKNTLHIIEMEISEKLIEDIKDNNKVRILGELKQLKTDDKGDLLSYPYV